MQRDLKTLYGYKLDSLDGDIGRVRDFYFDDENWVVRYLVADTGSWLTGRLVLISPHAFGRFNEIDGKSMIVNLTRKQIEASPSIDCHQPVSRQHEIDYFNHYGWPAYWNGTGLWGFGDFPVAPSLPPAVRVPSHPFRHRAEKHLRSTKAVTGYEIQSTDGAIGHVIGLRVDDTNWAVHTIVVETGHWYSGKEIFIATGKVKRISYEESKVFVSLTKEDIQHAPQDHVARAAAPAH